MSTMEEERRRVVILGAGGRDFHVFNTRYRHDHTREVVAFTAAQIPHIENRRYPAVLSGALYPDGIDILPQHDLEEVIRASSIDEVVFAYSDAPLGELAAIAERVEALGAVFEPYDVAGTQLPVNRPCVAVCAVRTGCGKSAVSRHLTAALRGQGHRVGVVRHPMPYGNLRRQVVQRFEVLEDLRRQDCTIEEME